MSRAINKRIECKLLSRGEHVIYLKSDLYEDYKTSLKDIKEDLTDREIQYVMDWQAQFCKDVKIAKLVYGFSVISIKMSTEYFKQPQELILKVMEGPRPRTVRKP